MKILQHFKKIPWYGWLVAAGLLVVQMSFYWLANGISNALGGMERAFVPKIASIDDAIPLLPIFGLFYMYSYVYWIEAYAHTASMPKEKYLNVIIGSVFANFCGIFFYVLLPTYMDREAEGILTVSEQPGFLNWILHFIYNNDGWERAYNLFPSFHCLISVYCFLPCLRDENTSKGYKIYSGIIAAGICLSTLFIKQHYIADFVVGIALGVGFYFLSMKVNLGHKILARKEKHD